MTSSESIDELSDKIGHVADNLNFVINQYGDIITRNQRAIHDSLIRVGSYFDENDSESVSHIELLRSEIAAMRVELERRDDMILKALSQLIAKGGE